MNPVLVEITRGNIVESRHRGAIAVADAEGKLVAAWGDVDAATYPRSAFKSLQALPLIESGAAAAWRVTEDELALACASHSGEVMHVERVERWRGPLRERKVDAQALVRLGRDRPAARRLSSE